MEVAVSFSSAHAQHSDSPAHTPTQEEEQPSHPIPSWARRRAAAPASRPAAAAGTAFLLRVPMHCRCHGCTDKIRAGVRDLTLNHSYGIQALDQSELGTKGELKVFATGDPHKLRRRLHKSTGKTVDLLLLGSNKHQQAAAYNPWALEMLLQQQQQAEAYPAAAYQYQFHHHHGAAYPGGAAAYAPYPQQGLGAYGGLGGVWPGHGAGY